MTDSPPRPDGGRSEPLTLAGAWFIAAGLGLVAPSITALMPVPFQGSSGGFISYAPIGLGFVFSTAAVLIGSVAAFVALARAGFPRRSRAMGLVTIGLAVAYPLQFFARFGYLFGEALWTIGDIIALIIGALLLAFAISAARNRLLPLGLRILPAVQFVLAVLGYLIAFRTTFPVSGVAFIVVGAAYVILAAHARSALEVAAVPAAGAAE